jgi:hypothetical protein
MRDIKVFNTVEEVYEILGKKVPAKYWEDPFYDELWKAGFNFDDWDIGFCCKEPFTHTEHENDDGTGTEWEEADMDVWWLVDRMECYCVGYHHVEYGGWHWYTVHHA